MTALAEHKRRLRDHLTQERLKLGIRQALQGLREILRKCNSGGSRGSLSGIERPAPVE
jgi:hypothetical protein